MFLSYHFCGLYSSWKWSHRLSNITMRSKFALWDYHWFSAENGWETDLFWTYKKWYRACIFFVKSKTRDNFYRDENTSIGCSVFAGLERRASRQVLVLSALIDKLASQVDKRVWRVIGRIILTGSCDLNLRMGGLIDISNWEREWPGNNGSPQQISDHIAHKGPQMC